MNVTTFCKRVNSEPKTFMAHVTYFALLMMFVSQNALPRGVERDVITNVAAITVFVVGRMLWLKHRGA
jgi:hypothetical protein